MSPNSGASTGSVSSQPVLDQTAELILHNLPESVRMAVELLPSYSDPQTSTPIQYTGNPFLLCWADTVLFFRLSWSLIGILHPVNQWNCKELDELYPSFANLLCLALHGFLIVLQLVFLLSVPLMVLFPVWTVGLYVAATLTVNYGICWILNGSEDFLESKTDLGSDATRFPSECWIYLNGVSVGKHWLQGNLERLALTFRRPITGVHNRTCGIIFDLIQCVIERNFCYATNDVRNAYALIKGCLLKEKHKKVILLLHSQGSIEGSLILDWLLSELSHDTVQKLEIYTFGSAANHFNNPHRTAAYADAAEKRSVISHNSRAVRHIEHYANDGDFVARWGVLSFTRMKNRYIGNVFTRSGMGHLLNQHYLNSMFPLGKDGRVIEENAFMEAEVGFSSEGALEKVRDEVLETFWNGGNGVNGAVVENVNSPVEPASVKRVESLLKVRLAKKKAKVKDFSRLWGYRDGGSPDH